MGAFRLDRDENVVFEEDAVLSIRDSVASFEPGLQTEEVFRQLPDVARLTRLDLCDSVFAAGIMSTSVGSPLAVSVLSTLMPLRFIRLRAFSSREAEAR